MECSCVRYTDLPHTSKLFADLVYNPERVRAFYSHIAGDPKLYEAIAGEIRFAPERRAALVSALREQNGDSESLAVLAHEGTVAVVTGQQAGLFSGPAYTIYKALKAVHLTRELAAHGIAAVPIFWVATEDHDFGEVNHTWIFDAEQRPIKLEMVGSPGSSQPVGQFVMSAPPTAELRKIFSGLPFGEEVSALVEEAYQPGKTLGEGFTALLKRLLGPYGFLYLDPMSHAMRELAAPAIRSALGQAPELTAAVLERNRELAAAGYHAQVHLDDHTSLVFLLENGRRYTLRRHGRDYQLNGRRFTTEELMERAAELSPNALLRPVVQDSMVPTLAYVGGPAELAYLAQSEVIYRSVLGRMPAALPRAGFTLLDHRGKRLMERYGLTLADCERGERVVGERMAARLIPPELEGTLAGTKVRVEEAADRLAKELGAFDSSLAAALDKSRKKMVYQIAKMERKIGHEIMARDARVSGDATYLCNLVYPQRHLQERLYSILPFLAKHGMGLIDELYGSLSLECPDHQLATV